MVHHSTLSNRANRVVVTPSLLHLYIRATLHDAYAKFEPRADSQNSLTTWFVVLAPRRLCESVSVSATKRYEEKYLIIFLRKTDFSSAVTLVLGNDECNKPDSSQLLAMGYRTTSFLRGSVSLSSSLREAFPPMFLVRL